MYARISVKRQLDNKSIGSQFIDKNGNVNIKIDSSDAYINIPKDKNEVVISSGSNTIIGNTTISVDGKTEFKVTDNGIEINTIDESEKVAAQCKLKNITEPNIAGTLSDGTNTINVEAGTRTVEELADIINRSTNFSAHAEVEEEEDTGVKNIILTAKEAGGDANKIVYGTSGCFKQPEIYVEQGSFRKGSPLNRTIMVDGVEVITKKDSNLVELLRLLTELKEFIPNMQILAEFLSAMVVENDSEEP